MPIKPAYSKYGKVPSLHVALLTQSFQKITLFTCFRKQVHADSGIFVKWRKEENCYEL
jgi:hypothetical protein